jgi:hypothetical protein
MGSAYTPGLKVAASTVVRKTRRLPLKGDVVVQKGEEVQPDTVVARTNIPGILRNVRAAERLGVDAEELGRTLRIAQGDPVTAGQILAESRSFFGMFKSECKCPVDGTVELISSVNGVISVREQPNPIEVNAYVRGRIAEVMPFEGVVVETRGALIQGIFGIGGERRGAIRMVVETPDEPLEVGHIKSEMAGQVIVGGSQISGAALRAASEAGVAGVVVGAIIDRDLIDFLGYDIGVAITGHEDINLTLILTEGFGRIRMADRTFRLLKSLEGQTASINGATQIRAGVIRPEIIVPREAAQADVASDGQALDIGTPIRIIREPYFGQLATVTALPPQPQILPTEAHVRVLDAELQSGERVTVPRANVEIIEE